MKIRLSFAFVILAVCAAMPANRQVVTASIVVNAGDTLRIPPGRQLLFAGYTGIEVKPGGHLQAIGTKSRPIVFTSVNDTAGAGAAFDWNGIDIKGSAKFAHSVITNAVSGITAYDAQNVVIRECTFGSNGQWHLSLAGEIQPVPDMQPYTHGAAARAAASTEEPIIRGDGNQPPAPAISLVDSTISRDGAPTLPDAVKLEKGSRSTLGWTLGGIGAAAAVGGAYSLYRMNSAAQEYNDYRPKNPDYDKATEKERQDNFDKLRRSHSAAQVIGWSLIGASAASLLYLTVFF